MFIVGSIYIPCTYPSNRLETDLNKLRDVLLNSNGFILGDDFNSKSPVLGDSLENTNGRIFKKWVEDNIMDIKPICDVHPSYPNGSSFLDHFLLSSHDTNNYRITSLPSSLTTIL